MAEPATASATEPTATAPAPGTPAADDSTVLSLRPLSTSSLPPHSSLNNSSSTVSAQVLATSLLTAGSSFLRKASPSFTAKGRPRSSTGSTSPVEILTYSRPDRDGKEECWFMRRSRHEDKAEGGTACWEEFDGGIRAGHSKNEAEYTPEVIEGRKVCEWEVGGGGGEEWAEVGLEIYEMAHKMPPPLTNRFFGIVVATARASDNSSLLVVQVPVDLRDAPGAKYSTGKGGKLVQGAYVSVEHIRKEPDGKILWEMATASDARGVLPMPVQKLGIPGAISKDVGLFLGWVEKNRKKS